LGGGVKVTKNITLKDRTKRGAVKHKKNLNGGKRGTESTIGVQGKKSKKKLKEDGRVK